MANGEALIGNAKGNPVGNSNLLDNPVTTIPQKGSRTEFVTVRNGCCLIYIKVY